MLEVLLSSLSKVRQATTYVTSSKYLRSHQVKVDDEGKGKENFSVVIYVLFWYDPDNIKRWINHGEMV